MYRLLVLVLFVSLTTPNIWATEVLSDSGFRYSISGNQNQKIVRPLDSASTPERRLIQLEDQVFLQYPGTRTLCADEAGVNRAQTVKKCIAALERILADESRDWALMSGIYLSAQDQVPTHLRDLSDARRDIFGFVWMPYEFKSDDLSGVFADLYARQQVQISDEAMLSALLNRKTEFRCLDQIDNCRRTLRILANLNKEALNYLKENSWITTVQVWPALNQVPRLAPNGSFSHYQLNLVGSESEKQIETAIASPVLN